MIFNNIYSSKFFNQMKKLFLILIAFLFIASCKKDEPVYQMPDNLLQTSDLETYPFFYNYSSNDSIISVWNEEDAHSPTHSIKISNTNMDTAFYSFWYQYYAGKMPVGEKLTLSAYIKGINLEGQGILLGIQCNAGKTISQFVTSSDTHITGTFDWTPFTLDSEELAGDVSILYLEIVYLPLTTGTVYIDDITLTHQ